MAFKFSNIEQPQAEIPAELLQTQKDIEKTVQVSQVSNFTIAGHERNIANLKKAKAKQVAEIDASIASLQKDIDDAKVALKIT